ncbi:peptidoglycan DD-metalloendopeptidase family protein [Acinetobacter piscicola]|uniref:peptidoglycan DD-metalloendopeptidase family protein n=1 Tax=Acinetobacter piscicola TaxID=2006115 RepID=UPI000B7D1505|nr:peptidoglycan DD-metalloendopeptidase family protein [Acinetobacter piscicola]
MSNIYIIKAGDTLWGISKKYHTTVKELAKINSLHGKKIHNLKIGQKIHLKADLNGDDEHETQLKIIILDLAFKPILSATIQLEFDGKKITKTTKNGVFENILIGDHSKGLKVYYKNVNGTFDLIANHKSLPVGKKVLKLTSRKIKVEGNHYGEKGVPQYSITSILNDLKVEGRLFLEGIGGALGSSNSPSKANKVLTQVPSEKKEQKRTDNGNSTHIIASQFTEDNFLLKPVNNKYRRHIISAAKRHGFTPHALAAVIDAEAAKIRKTGEWNVNSKADSSSAAGLTQFLDGTWLAMCKDKTSLVGQYVLANPKLSELQKLNLRFNAEMAIDAAAAYAVSNFKASGLPYQNLTEPSSMAKFAYLLHHEGSTGGKNFVLNTLSEERAHKLLFTQFGKKGHKQASNFLKRFSNAKAAYGAWLRNYIDGHIDIYNYMVNKEKTSKINISMDETIKLLKGQSVAMPAPKPQTSQPKKTTDPSKPTISPSTRQKVEQEIIGGADSWHNPLASCKLRTAGLANAKGATFGKVRSNETKNHQGVDLQANPGEELYAVCGGMIEVAEATTGAYGKIVVLKVNINDLPAKQKKYAQSKLSQSTFVYFFYAHLSVISVEKKTPVDVGDVIGKTGDTGNAKGMNTIAKGGHLHFEARSEPVLGKGLAGRIDPIPFIDANLPY